MSCRRHGPIIMTENTARTNIDPSEGIQLKSAEAATCNCKGDAPGPWAGPVNTIVHQLRHQDAGSCGELEKVVHGT